MAKFEITAEPRETKGTSASRRLRHAGRIPAILYGVGKDARMLTLDHNEIGKHIRDEKFVTSILTVKTGSESEQAILRAVQMHPWRPIIQHIDLQRVSATEKLHMRVPLHFINEASSPGVKQQGGIVAHLLSEVDITCLPKDLPEFLTMDVIHMSIGQSLHLSDIPLPAGVTITSFAHGGEDLAVFAITAPRAEEVEAAPEVAAAAAPVAEAGKAEAGKAAAPAAAGKAAAPAAAGKAAPAKKEGGKK